MSKTTDSDLFYPIGTLILLAVMGVILIFFILPALGLTSNHSLSAIPSGTTLNCKIQEESLYYVISTEGASYRIGLEEWALLNTPICD